MKKNEVRFWLIWMLLCTFGWWLYKPLMWGILIPVIRNIFYDWRKEVEDSDLRQQVEQVTITEDNQHNSSADNHSILIAIAVVSVFFGGVYLFNYFGKLTFDNIFIFAVFIFACISLWGSNNKDKIHEILEFKEPTIGDSDKK